MTNKIKTYSHILEAAFNAVDKNVLGDEFCHPIFIEKERESVTEPAEAVLFVGDKKTVDELNEEPLKHSLYNDPVSRCRFDARLPTYSFTVSMHNHIGDDLYIVFSSGDSSFIWGTRNTYNDLKDTNVLRDMIDDVRYLIEYCYDYLDCDLDNHMRVRKGTIRRAPYPHIKKMLIKIAKHNLDKREEARLEDRIKELKSKMKEERDEEIEMLESFI